MIISIVSVVLALLGIWMLIEGIYYIRLYTIYKNLSDGDLRSRQKVVLRRFIGRHKLGSFLEIDSYCRKMKIKGKILIVSGAVLMLSGIVCSCIFHLKC